MHMPHPALPAQYMHVQWHVQSDSFCIFQKIQQAKESQIAYTLIMKELSLSLSVYFLSLSLSLQGRATSATYLLLPLCQVNSCEVVAVLLVLIRAPLQQEFDHAQSLPLCGPGQCLHSHHHRQH